MQTINWGIIGCGDVSEMKSGPAFNKVANSRLAAVMRRDKEKAADYARRHNVSKFYTDAYDLINDPEITTIYIATPPSFHEEYALQVITAGKKLYIEKPVALTAASAQRIHNAVTLNKADASVAHYRRAWPKFNKVKQLINDKAIGEVRLASLKFFRQALTKEQLLIPKTAWRVDPKISGGGLFHDLAPHQLDLMLYFFGEPKLSTGIAINQSAIYQADDHVSGEILFENNVVFTGNWCFNIDKNNECDICEIYGSEGKMSFSIFGNQELKLENRKGQHTLNFPEHEHVQQPMIEKVVDYFLGRSPNPCSTLTGVKVMELLDGFTKNS